MVVALVTLGAGFTSCSDDDDEFKPTVGEVVLPSEGDGSITASTAAFTFNTTGVTDLAYKAVKANEVTRAAATPDAEQIFNEATKTFPMQDGENTIVVDSLVGATDYVIYFAMKTVNNTYLLEEHNVTTADYGEQVVSLSGVSTTTAKLTLTTNGVLEVAHKVVKVAEAGETAPDAAIVFAEAEKVLPVVDGENVLDVEGLEGATDYVVYVAMKLANETFVLEECSFTTSEYGDQILTMISTTPFSVKFHVNMPDTADWVLLLGDRETYEQMKMYFGQSDAGFLESVGCINYRGSQTIEIKDGDFWYTEVDWDGSVLGDMTYTIKPGSAYVMLISAAYWGEVPNVWPETWRWMPYYEVAGGGGGWDDWVDDDMGVMNTRGAMNLGEYTEVCTDEGVTFTHEYAKQCFWTNPAALPAEGEGVEVTLRKLTERTAYFEMVPSENCLSYHVLPLSDEDYSMLTSFIGEAGMQAYVLNYGEPLAGGNEYVMSGLTVGANYHMMVTGLFEENGAVQSFHHSTFSPQESTLPLPVIEVTSVEEKNTHDKVYFNIKCSTKDATAGKYIANYVKDWIPELNSGYSYNDMVEMYGQILTEEELDQVNSDEGYELFYTTYEDVATRLAVVAYNEDEKAGEAVWADSKAAGLPAKTKVESSLYADLEGNWVLNYWDTQSYLSSENSDKSKKYRQFQTTITTNPDFGPASFAAWQGDASYDFVLGALGGNEARVKSLFDEYKAVAAYHKEKYASQNQIVSVNFPCGYYVKADKQNVYTPWDLFTSEYYSAYDNFELFYDFGPKVFFEVKRGDSLVLKSDMNALPPMESFDGAYYMVGIGKNGTTNQYLLSCEFPVTISEDKNTLTVHPVEYEGVLYYPGTVQYNYGYAYPQNVTYKELVYTRGTLEDAQSPVAAKRFSVADAIKASRAVYNATEGVAIDFTAPAKRNAKLQARPKLNRVEGKLFDVKANFEKNRK